MRKILVASHGYLADGIKSSVKILTGLDDVITVVNAYVDESDYTCALQDFIDSVGDDDEGVIFTDIYGGSVFQKVALMEPEKRGIFHVTGMNLAVVIEMLIRMDPLTKELVDEIVGGASDLLMRVEPLPQQAAAQDADDSDDAFFA